MEIIAYTDVNWATDQGDKRSTDEYSIFLARNLVLWSSKMQKVVSQSSIKVEYKTFSRETAEISWMKSLLSELKIELSQILMVWCDNKSAIALAENLICHGSTNYIKIDVHFIRDKITAKKLEVKYVTNKNQVADILIKTLPTINFE